MERAVCNTSPLIFLSKLGRLALLYKLFSEVSVPETVVREALRSIEKHGDALEIKAALEQGKLKAKPAPPVPKGGKAAQLLGLHEGELSALLLAKKEKTSIVLVDDLAAIKAAKYMGLTPQSTPFLLLLALKQGLLPFDEFKQALDGLLNQNYRISPPLYQEILEKAQTLQKK
ncbi:MAG: DUF3368 domain-containing protein [Candidatus Micrarchaeia archaeon]|jgi:predicted nucleic acid-binding protein